MSAPYNPNLDVQVARGSGLYLRINGRPVDDTYGAIVMAELAQLRDFPDVRVDVDLRTSKRPTPLRWRRSSPPNSGATKSGSDRDRIALRDPNPIFRVGARDLRSPPTPCRQCNRGRQGSGRTKAIAADRDGDRYVTRVRHRRSSRSP